MPRVIHIAVVRLFLICIAIFITINICLAQSAQMQVVAVWDPTGPNVVYLTPLHTYEGTSTVLNWTAASNASSYTAQVSTTSYFTSILTNSSTSSLTATFTNLPEGIILYYRIIPYTNLGNAGLPSNTVFATTDKTAPITLVTNVSVVINKIQINYDAQDNLSGVQNIFLYYRFNGGSWINFGNIPLISPYLFDPLEGNGTYDFLTIGQDNVDNIEIKTLTPESTVNFNYITPTPSPTVQPSIVPTLTPTGILDISKTPLIQMTTPPFTTILPNPDSGIPVEIYTIPNSKIIIKTSNGEAIYSVDNTGIFKSSTYKNTKITVKIFSDSGELTYIKDFTAPDRINFITPPVFNTYYIIHSITEEFLQIKGKAFPKSSVKNFNFEGINDIENTTNADSNGNFLFKLDLKDLKDKFKESSTFSDDNTDLDNTSIYNFNIYGQSFSNNLTSDKSKMILIIITLDIFNENNTNKDNSENIFNTPLLNLLKLPQQLINFIVGLSTILMLVLNLIFFIPLIMLIISSYRYKVFSSIYLIAEKNKFFINEYLSKINLNSLSLFAHNIIIFNVLSLISALIYFIFTYTIIGLLLIILNLTVSVLIFIIKIFSNSIHSGKRN